MANTMENIKLCRPEVSGNAVGVTGAQVYIAVVRQ